MSKKAKVSKYGQWQYPGEHTIVPDANGSITMKGVPYPVFGIDDLGNQQMMMPGGEYQFPGNSVYEIPMMAYGGHLPKAQSMGEFLYVKSKDDPAYVAYNDSLDLYNKSMVPRLTGKKSFGQYGSYGLRGRNVTDVPLPEGYTVPGPIQPIGQRITRGYYPQYVTIRPPYTPGGKEYRKKTHDVYKEPTRKVVVDETVVNQQKPTPNTNTTPATTATQPKSEKPKDGYRRTPIGTANNGTVIRVHDNNQRFIRWEDENGNIIPIENATGSPSTDFDPIYKPNKAYGGDISVPDLRRVTINALPKAQSTGEFSNPDFKPSWDWTQTAAENAELNRRAQLAGHNSVDEYRASGWAWQPKQYQTPSVQDQVFTGRHSVAKEDVPLPTMTKSKIPGLSKSTDPDVQMLQQKAADVAEWVDTKYKEESPEEKEQRNRESFIQHNITPSKEDLEGVNPETGYAKAAYTGRPGTGTKLGGMSLWNPQDVANSGINDADVNEYLNALYTKQQQADRVGQITLDLGFSKDEKEKERLSAELKDKKYILDQADKVLNDTAFLKKLWDYQQGLQESQRKANMIGTATSTMGPLDAAVGLVAAAPALTATMAAPILGTSLTVGNVVNPLFYAAGVNGFLNPNSDFAKAATSWSKGTGSGTDVLWEAALNSLNFLGAKSVPSDIGNFGKAYKEIATGESIIPYAWKSPAVGLSQEASADMFNSLLNSGKMTPVERNIVLEYQHNPSAFTGRYGPVDPVKRSALNDIIGKYELQFPQNSNVIATRRFSFDKAGKSTLGADVQGRNINFGDRPTSFSAGLGVEGYQGAPDRLVIPSRYLPKMKNNFIAQEYSAIPKENLELIGQPSMSSRQTLIDFGSGIGTRNEIIGTERELIGTGLDFKQIGKVKNDIGGFDVIVKPKSVATGTSTTKNATGQPQWVKPSKTQLTQEFRVEHQAKGSNYFGSEEEFQKAVNEAKVEEITPEMDQAIQNKSRHASREAMIESNKNYKSWPKYRNENTVDAIYEGMQTGAEMDMPIILEFQDGTRRMFSGNTRMDVAFQSGKNPQALIVKVPEASAAGGAGETLGAAGETSNWGAKRSTDFVKTEHEDLANTIDELRADRIKFWETPKGKARLEAVIENTPELKAGGLTVDDYIAGMRSMTNENRTAANQLAKASEILATQEKLINDFENIRILEQDTGMAYANAMTEAELDTELAKLQKQLDDLQIDFNRLSVNSDKVDNAFMNRKGVINLNKVEDPTKLPNPYTKFTTGVGPYFTISDAKRVIDHEFGHLVQRGVQTNLDKELKNLELLNSEARDLFSSAKNSSPDTQAYDAVFNKTNEYFKRARKYFRTGNDGQEKLPFLEEVRADMLQKGIIKDLGDDITEGMIRQHYANYMMEAQGGKYPLRLYDIMKNNPNNFKLLQSVMNKMPVAVIGAGVGYGMMGGDEESQPLPQKKRGGGIKHVDFIASRNKAMLESLPKAQTGGGPKLNSNPDFEVSYDISKSPEENMELNKRARQMGWNSVEEYKNSNWGQNQEGVNKVLQSNRDRKRYTSWQGVTGPGEEPISQDERTVLENTLKNVENWEKGWYSKRAMLPQFTGVAMERLSKLNEQKTVPWGDTSYENAFPDWAGHYSAAYNTVNIKRNQLDNESLLTHERSHWYDFNAPQLNKNYYYDFYEDGKYKMPDYNKLYDPILKSIIPYEFSDFHTAHYRGFDPLQIPINANKQYDTEIEKILDADVPLESTDNFNSLQDILKPFSSQDAHNYQYTPTEIRSRLNEWRKYNNIDPLKNYTDEEIQNIIDKEINDPNKHSWWNNMDLYKVVRGRGDLLKKLNDAYVSNGNRQSSDGVFRGKRGGQLPKAQTQGQTSNPNFEPSYDWQKSAAENIELNKRAQIAGWNSVKDYEKSGWAYNSRPGFAYQPDRSVPSGPQVAAPQLQNVQRNIAASKPGASVSVPQPLRQQRVAAGQPNPAYEKSSVGPTKLNAAIANENAVIKEQKAEAFRQETERRKQMTPSQRMNDAAGLPSVPIFEAALMAPVALSSLGAASTTLGEATAAFEAIPEVAGALRVKGAYDLGSKTIPETYKNFKDYSRTGNTDALMSGLGNVAQTSLSGFSNFGPWQTGAKQIGKYYGIGSNAYDTASSEDAEGFVKSGYNTFTGARGVLKGKKKGGPTNTDTLPKAQTGIPSDYERFLQYSETAPENRRPDADWQYGNPRQYDHYGMWDALGKPENFEQALEMNPHWQPDPYDESYHGFSTNPNTGVWLKSHIPGESHPGDTGWMEYKDFMLSNDRNWGGKNQNLVYDPDLQRMRYVDRKNQGGDVKRVTIKSLPKNWKTK